MGLYWGKKPPPLSASSWYIPSTGDAQVGSIGVGFGPKFLKGFEASISVQGGKAWIMIENETFPQAKYLTMPANSEAPPGNWQRFYWLEVDLVGLALGLGGGKGTTPAIGYTRATSNNYSKGRGHIDRRTDHTSLEQEKGDPTGFIGPAIQIGGGLQAGFVRGATGGHFFLGMGVSVFDVAAYPIHTLIGLRSWLSNPAHRPSLPHLVVKYTAVYEATADTLQSGASFGLNAEYSGCEIKRVHAFCRTPPLDKKKNSTDQLPPGVEMYCYSRQQKAGGGAGGPYFDKEMTSRFDRYTPGLANDYLTVIKEGQRLVSFSNSFQKRAESYGLRGPNAAEADLQLGNLYNQRKAARTILAIMERNRTRALFQPFQTMFDLQDGSTVIDARRAMNAGLDRRDTKDADPLKRYVPPYGL